MTIRFPSPYLIPQLSDAGLRERLSEARTMLMYGHNPRIREAAMVAIENINAELARRAARVRA